MQYEACISIGSYAYFHEVETLRKIINLIPFGGGSDCPEERKRAAICRKPSYNLISSPTRQSVFHLV